MAEKSGIGDLLGQAGGRSVWQVLVVYLGASWGVLEVVDVLKDNMGLPDWVFPFAVVLLLIGLPVMLGSPDHVALRLRKWRLTTRQTVLTSYAVTAVLGIAAIVLAAALERHGDRLKLLLRVPVGRSTNK